MSKKKRSKPDPSDSSLHIYCLGPGIGESIVLRLPGGGWGVIDCYEPEGKRGPLAFLQEKNIQELEFFCLTHPHEDHFLGAHRLLRHYSGRIKRIWHHLGFTSKDIKKIRLTTKCRAKYKGDPEAASLLSEYDQFNLQLTEEIGIAKFSEDNHRAIIVPTTPLIQNDNITITAVCPNTQTVLDFRDRLAKVIVKKGPLLLGEEGGDFINSVSVALHIHFGATDVFLLGDAQGSQAEFHQQIEKLALVKIAHHGSENGRGSDHIINPHAKPHVRCAIVTPFKRYNLPRQDMEARFRKACKNYLRTNIPISDPPPRGIPGLSNPRAANGKFEWVGIEISKTGKIRTLSV